MDTPFTSTFPIISQYLETKDKKDVLRLYYVQDTFNIEVIDLVGNKIKTLPESAFVGLKKLRSLRLQRNQITEVGEAVFRDLVSLKNLELHENLLTRIASNALASCSKLTTLNLAKNSLVYDGQAGPDGRTLNRFLASQPFEAMEKLNLSHNAISEIDESLQFNFLNLMSLDLSYNSFTGFFLDHFSFIKVAKMFETYMLKVQKYLKWLFRQKSDILIGL